MNPLRLHDYNAIYPFNASQLVEDIPINLKLTNTNLTPELIFPSDDAYIRVNNGLINFCFDLK